MDGGSHTNAATESGGADLERRRGAGTPALDRPGPRAPPTSPVRWAGGSLDYGLTLPQFGVLESAPTTWDPFPWGNWQDKHAWSPSGNVNVM